MVTIKKKIISPDRLIQKVGGFVIIQYYYISYETNLCFYEKKKILYFYFYFYEHVIIQ